MRVLARLASSIVTVDGLLHLDGLLAYVAYLQHPERDSLPPVDLEHEPIDFELPLARWRWGDSWGWCASSIEADWVAEETRYASKPTPSAQMARYSDSPSVNVGAGPHKAWRLPFPARLASEARWYALGDLDAVRDMLRYVHHLGKLRHHGAGEILGWDVAPWDADWSLVRGGRPMRYLPWGWPDVDGHRVVAALRPPYWHSARQADAMLPQQVERGPR